MKSYGKALTDQEVKELHNAKCNLDSFVRHMEGVITADRLKDIKKAVSVCDKILKPIYKQEDKDQAKLERAVRHLEKDSPATWSTDHYPSDHILPGYKNDKQGTKVRFIVKDAWIQPNGEEYESGVFINPTYKDAFLCFKTSIETTGDRHHVFFEGVKFLEKDEDGVYVFDLVSGS